MGKICQHSRLRQLLGQNLVSQLIMKRIIIKVLLYETSFWMLMKHLVGNDSEPQKKGLPKEKHIGTAQTLSTVR